MVPCTAFMVEVKKPSVVLFGPPGVGKSTVGQVFHDEFGFNFYDGDDEMTPQERALISKGLWGDDNRKLLLIRTAARMNQLHQDAKKGLVTSLALTKQWMREFLTVRTDEFLQFVLVVTLLQQEEMEKKVKVRHAQGHPITVEAFRTFTQAFESPAMAHLTIENPHEHSKKDELITQVANILTLLK